jgi:hypothetical protein
LQIGAVGNTTVDDLFLFFLTSTGKNIFKKHLQHLVVNCTQGPFQFISKYLVDEGWYSYFVSLAEFNLVTLQELNI